MFEELDPDLRLLLRGDAPYKQSPEIILLVQIIRLLKDKDVEEKSPAVKGFGV